MKIDSLRQQLQGGETIIMDAAMGTEIQRRGVKTTLPLWSAACLLTDPEVVKDIHADYIKAGAQIIITNTFRTTSRAFAKKNMAEKAKLAALLACRLAKEAIAEVNSQIDVYTAGSMAPLEDCYSPQLTPPKPELEREHYEYALNLKEGGVDFLLLETMITQREITAACKAAQEIEMPFAVSFCCNDQGELLGGERLEVVVEKVLEYKPLFLSINCVSPANVLPNIKILKKSTSLPLAAYAQGEGSPDDDEGWQFTDGNSPQKYLKYAQLWLENGVQIIGGCCGTTPTYIKLLKKELSK